MKKVFFFVLILLMSCALIAQPTNDVNADLTQNVIKLAPPAQELFVEIVPVAEVVSVQVVPSTDTTDCYEEIIVLNEVTSLEKTYEIKEVVSVEEIIPVTLPEPVVVAVPAQKHLPTNKVKVDKKTAPAKSNKPVPPTATADEILPLAEPVTGSLVDTACTNTKDTTKLVLPIKVVLPVQLLLTEDLFTEDEEYEKPCGPCKKTVLVPCPKPNKSETAQPFESDGAISKKMALDMPTAEKIKNDLIGCTLLEQIDGYCGGNWTITIAKGDIQKIDILQNSINGPYLFIDLYLILQNKSGGTAWAACQLQYEVGSYDWLLKTVYTKEMNYLKTGYYDQYVTIDEVTTPLMGTGKYLPLVNHCSTTLAVGGTYVVNNIVKKFYQLVPGNGVVFVHDYDIQNPQLHFVEFPF